MEITEPLMAVSNTGLSIISETVAEKVRKKNISPSLVTALAKCPASWAADNFVLRDLLPQEEDNAATRGSLFHRVMEHAFELEPEERTRERIDSFIPIVLEEKDFQSFKGNEEALAWLNNAIDGYYRMGGNPKKVKVAEYKRAGDEESKKGLEVFVKGKIGNTERETLGFIDRLAVDHKDPEGVIIEDWKTGAKAKVWNPKTKSDDGKAEARQQVMYSMILKDEGVKVTGARLLFPVAEKVVPVDTEDEDFNKMVVKEVEETDQALTTMIETNNFEFKPNVLCNWCPMAKICPRMEIGKFPKAREAFAKQPAIEKLAPGFEFI